MVPSDSMNPDSDQPKIYTSRYKKSEKVLKSCFIACFILLALWLLKIIVLDSVTISANAYNPRLRATESRYIRGSILDRNGKALAREVQAEDGSYYRTYPYGSALGLVTGYSDQSKSGLELKMNSYLLSAGSFTDMINYWILDKTIPGCDVVTTIDGELSQYAYDRLGDFNGVVIVTEADTGRLITLVSKPYYDPNTVMEEWDVLMEDENNPFFDRAAQGLYPPGSTFKMITSLAWYRSQNYTTDYHYTCSGVEYFNNYDLACIGGSVHGELDIQDAFAYSCNTFFATLGNRIGAQQLIRTMESVGFGKKLDFILPSSTSQYGLTKDATEDEIAATAIGQGETEMTPLLLNRLTCAVANQGKVYAYEMVDKVLNQDGTVKKQYLPEKPEQLITEEEAAYLQDLMEGVTEYGTATNLSWLGIPAYGKTGTAENASGVDHSWFTGYVVPEEGSPIAITVLVEQSGGRLYASSVATDVLWTLFN